MPSAFVRMLTTRNVGRVDRLIRVLPALLVACFAYSGTLNGPPAWVLGIAAGMLLATSVTGSCTIYYLLGFSTCPLSGQRLR